MSNSRISEVDTMNETHNPVSPGQTATRTAPPRPGPQEQPAVSPGGLSGAEVEQRRAKFGYNELPEKEVNPVLKFLSYFWGPIPWMIEAAVILWQWGRGCWRERRPSSAGWSPSRGWRAWTCSARTRPAP
jgi:magnesium-transporting ATPase (P-type)